MSIASTAAKGLPAAQKLLLCESCFAAPSIGPASSRLQLRYSPSNSYSCLFQLPCWHTSCLSRVHLIRQYSSGAGAHRWFVKREADTRERHTASVPQEQQQPQGLRWRAVPLPNQPCLVDTQQRSDDAPSRALDGADSSVEKRASRAHRWAPTLAPARSRQEPQNSGDRPGGWGPNSQLHEGDNTGVRWQYAAEHEPRQSWAHPYSGLPPHLQQRESDSAHRHGQQEFTQTRPNSPRPLPYFWRDGGGERPPSWPPARPPAPPAQDIAHERHRPGASHPPGNNGRPPLIGDVSRTHSNPDAHMWWQQPGQSSNHPHGQGHQANGRPQQHSRQGPFQQQHQQQPPFRPKPKPVSREVMIPRDVTVSQLASMLGVAMGQLEAALEDFGMKVSGQEDRVAPDVIELAAMQFDKIAILPEASKDMDHDAVSRPAVVTIMGHVDHGKTSLLDALRETAVAAGEYGGITQHIGAFVVPMPDSNTSLTFLDTPGHAAFSAMRARGASVTDIVVLVVAADDGVMPQTKEAIGHAVAAGCPIVVAITKCDRPDADPEKVKRQLQAEGVELEEAGGTVQVVMTSASKREGLPDLETAILLQSELMSLRASTSCDAEGIVVEAKVDRGQGPVATVIVKRGTLSVGDIVVVGTEWGRVKSLKNAQRDILSSVAPGLPAEIAGLRGVPMAGDDLLVLPSEERAKRVSEARSQRAEEYRHSRSAAAIRQLNQQRQQQEQQQQQQGPSDVPQVAISIKADVQGSVEALSSAIQGLANDSVGVKIVSSGLGPITASDVELAKTMGCKLVSFGVKAPAGSVTLQAKQNDIDVVSERVIYHLLTSVSGWLADALPKIEQEEVLGSASVLQVFPLGKDGKAVAGCRISDGQVMRANRFRVLRNDDELYCGGCMSLKREKADVDMVAKGFECGVLLDSFHEYKPGDVLQCFKIDMVPPPLAKSMRL